MPSGVDTWLVSPGAVNHGVTPRDLLLRGHPFMTSTWRGEGVRLRWTHVDGGRGVQPHVDVHTEN